MMFFNKKSEVDKLRDEISATMLNFVKDNERIDDRIRDLYSSINITENILDSKINREVSYIEKRIDEINNDIKVLTNIGLGLLALVIVILCVAIGYSLTH